MSDDGDKKSDAALRLIKAKSITQDQKAQERSDVKASKDRETGMKQKAPSRPNCGCNRPCKCGRLCGCVHSCVTNRYNPRHAFYFRNPRADCQTNWLSDYSSCHNTDSCGRTVTHWNNSGDELTGGCASLHDTGDHVHHQIASQGPMPYHGSVSYSYRGTSPYIDQYERAQARKRLSHYVHDGVYF